jgi:hypothetical protein
MELLLQYWRHVRAKVWPKNVGVDRRRQLISAKGNSASDFGHMVDAEAKGILQRYGITFMERS